MVSRTGQVSRPLPRSFLPPALVQQMGEAGMFPPRPRLRHKRPLPTYQIEGSFSPPRRYFCAFSSRALFRDLIASSSVRCSAISFS